MIPDKSKRAQYEEMLLPTSDYSLLNELLDYEILDSNEKLSKRLNLLRLPRANSSDNDKHYDLLDSKHLPTLHDGFLVQVNVSLPNLHQTFFVLVL
jgi:hypothetical protein